MVVEYLTLSQHLLGGVISRYCLQIVKHDRSAMGEWYAYYENSEFIVGIGQDRSGFVSIELGSKPEQDQRRIFVGRGLWAI